MKKNYKKILKLLNKLNEVWDDDLELFANAGFLMLISHETDEVIDAFPEIHCDGGDCGTHWEEDKEYLDRK